MTMRYVFEVNLGEEDKPKMALALAQSIAIAQKAGVGLTIFTPMIKDFRHSFFADVIGDAAARDLVNKKAVQVANVPIHLAASTTIVPHREIGVIIGLWCSSDMLATLDQCVSANSIIVVSYNLREVQPWAQKHRISIQTL